MCENRVGRILAVGGILCQMAEMYLRAKKQW
jgi:hypothetical protein